VVRFLQALVGYSRHDCATQLGRSQAGLQFLGLAAALVSSMVLFDSVQRVWTMLEDSASDKQLLPTPNQVKGLLASLESRCVCAKFMDLVLDWQRNTHDWSRNQGGITTSLDQTSYYPDPEGLAKLVSAFRQLKRIGSASITTIYIRTKSCTQWVSAFTEWCLGEQPSVLTQDGWQVIGSSIQVVITALTDVLDDSTPGFEVSVEHGVQGLDCLISSGI
jgi:hypothetical protein